MQRRGVTYNHCSTRGRKRITVYTKTPTSSRACTTRASWFGVSQWDMLTRGDTSERVLLVGRHLGTIVPRNHLLRIVGDCMARLPLPLSGVHMLRSMLAQRSVQGYTSSLTLLTARRRAFPAGLSCTAGEGRSGNTADGVLHIWHGDSSFDRNVLHHASKTAVDRC